MSTRFLRLVDDGGGDAPNADVMLHDEALQAAIKHRLLFIEAQRNNVVVFGAEVEAAYKQLTMGWDSQELKQTMARLGLAPVRLKQMLREQLTCGRALRKVVLDRVVVADKDIDDYMAHHAEVARVAERLHVRQIVVKDVAQAKDVAQKIRSGLPFAEAAMRYSLAPEGVRGGDIGTFVPSGWPKAMQDALSNLPPQKVSPIVAGPDGAHLFWLVERLPEKKLSTQQTRLIVQRRLRQRLEETAERQFYAQALTLGRIKLISAGQK